ncbi:type I pullulanase [Priestia abyssalis]|uniref:type I pullulanase n=1 Tax=Priestia abyssalis TaxID=1221450 RepID=UPI000995829E|nr:type I pullulanase [Priestia abyssalis]
MTKSSRLFEAYLDRVDLIVILVPKTYAGGHIRSFYLTGNDRKEPLTFNKKSDLSNYIKYECPLSFYVQIGQEYQVTDEWGAQTDLQMGAVIRTDEFDSMFHYTGNDLGVTYAPQKSTFKVWAPTATKTRVKIINPETGREREVGMNREPQGVWSCSVMENIEGCYYAFTVYVNGVWREANDPYAKAMTANSQYSVVVDLRKTDVNVTARPPMQYETDAIIYEMHIRDFSIHPHSGIKQKGKYMGLTEERTRGSKGQVTGMDYLKDLGITHVELLPVNDFGGVDELQPEKSYNWGYNPLYFQVPEGSYASNPHNPYTRIKELKQVVNTFHQNGLRVILDVVFNHVFVREESSFEQLVPGYFFRHDQHGMPSNGTGVGNDFASERAMARKFIVDSVLFWLKEYNVDGFRFDLMGILDVETMKEIRMKLDAIDPSIMIFGEGWDLNTPLSHERKATIQNAVLMPRVAHFNDRFRDCIKGSTFNLYDRGFALGHTHRKGDVKQSIAGSIALVKGEKGLFCHPNQTINYVESHDNHTLWDKLRKCNDFEDEVILRKRQRLATTMVLLSQGIPFIHSGQEFCRTKQGVENSYQSPDHINQLDWNRQYAFRKDVEYIKGIISIRKHHGAFRFTNAPSIRRHFSFLETSDHLVVYQLLNVKEYGPWSAIMVAFNQDTFAQSFSLERKGIWYIAADDRYAGTTPCGTIKKTDITVSPVSTLVLFQP